METVTNLLQEALAFLAKIMSSSYELLVVTIACVLSIIGFIVLYKKGPRYGIPISLSGILMIVMAVLARLRNQLS
jgi:uncharacterized membrane protein YhhN